VRPSGAGGVRFRFAGHRRKRRGGVRAPKRLRVLRGRHGRRPPRRVRGTRELALQGRRGGLHHPGLRREGRGRARGPPPEDPRRVPPGDSVLIVPTPPEIRDAYGLAADACAVPPDGVSWDAWVASQPRWTQPPRATRTNMIYTSGTTGRPKGVRRQPATPEMQATMAAMVSR